MQRLPYASDSAVRSFVALLLEQMDILYSVDIALCYDYIYDQEQVAKLDITKYFPKELREKEFLMMGEVIRSAATQKHRPPQEKEIERQRAGVLNSLAQRYGDDVQMLADSELGKKNKAKMCQLTYDFTRLFLDYQNGSLALYCVSCLRVRNKTTLIHSTRSPIILALVEL